MPGASALNGPFGRNLVHRLADDLQALAHFRHAHHDIARSNRRPCASARRNRIRRSSNTGKTCERRRPRRSPRSSGPETPMAIASAALSMPTPLRARQPDAILRQQVFVFVDVRRAWHSIDAPHAVEPVRRRLERQAADAEVAGHHPLAGDVLVNLHDLFALAEAVEEHGHRAQVDGVRPQPHQVRGDARQFRQQHADVLRALGNFESEQLLDGQADSPDCSRAARGNRCGR